MDKPTLYILDDDEQYAALLAEFASGAGWNAIAESDPVTFLDKDFSDVNVLVLDLIMPKLDGIEIIRAIAEKKCEIILILVSGFDARVLHSAQQLAEAHNIKVAASLIKPIPIDEFVKVLASIKTD